LPRPLGREAAARGLGVCVVHLRDDDLPVADPERLDPALLAERQRDEVPELDDLRLAEVGAQPFDQRLFDAPRVPDQVARVEERRLLTVVEPLRALELQQLVVVLLRRRPLSARERPLRASVVAVDRL
jgi:hypothetical protein